MRPYLFALALLMSPLALAPMAAPAFAAEAEAKPTLPGGVTVAKVRKIVEGLGHTTELGTEPGSPYFTFKVDYEGLDVWVTVEESGSTEYIWLKTSFRDVDATDDFRKLLGGNFDVQPAQFYITDDKLLWMAVAVENRNIDSAAIERGLQVLLDAISTSRALWLKE